MATTTRTPPTVAPADTSLRPGFGRAASLIGKYLLACGPGLVVAFADTEAGSITTAATSGAQFGMKLVL